MGKTLHILNFHGIGEPHMAVEDAERPYWITADFFREIVGLVLDRPDGERVRWTFDDGNRSDLETGAAHLASRGLTGSFFLLSARTDQPHYLSARDARALTSMSMTVGLHGQDHVDWRTLDDRQRMIEMVDARHALEDIIAEPVDHVAIPFGAYNRRVIGDLRRYNFSRIYTSDGGRAREGALIQNRTSIRADMTLGDVTSLLDNRESWARRARRTASALLRRHLV